MKKGFTTLLMLLIATMSSYAATYYSTGNVDPRTLTNWKTNTDGSGLSPANFAVDGDIFIVQAVHEMVFPASGAVWDITGNGATLRILGKLTAGRITTVANFEVANGGYYVQNYGAAGGVMPGTVSRTIGETSTVEIINYDTSQRLPNLIWGKLIISFNAGANWTLTNTTSFETKGDLIIRRTGNSNVRYLLLTSGSIDAVVGGNLIIENGIFALSGSTSASNDLCRLTVKGDLIVDYQSLTNTAVSTMVVTYSNANNAIFSLIVEGNTEIRNGNFEPSRVNTNNSSNINMDFYGNFNVSTNGNVTLSKATSGTIKAISMIVGGNFEVNGTFTGTAGASWTDAQGGATVYFKGGAANSSFKMPAGQGATNIAYVIGENKTLTLQSDIVTDKFLAVAGALVEGGYTVTGTKHVLVSPTVNFNGGIAEITKSVITLPTGETVTSLSLVPGMEVTSSKNYLAPNTVITQIIDPTTITISRAAIGTYSDVLPLTLVDFNAVREANGIRLHWRTAQEINVKQIEIERSVDGISFIKIGSLAANNNAGEHLYTYLDRNASTSLYNYYRLKTIDYDGSVDYSKELVAAPLSIVMSEIHLYPNPVNSYVEVNFPLETGKGYVKVLAVDGRIMKQETVSKTQKSLRLDLSSLAKSLYILVYEDGNGKRYTSRFVKN
ncbi:T9SS type A sorting domain-containing protein [Pedobacter sp. UBA4863]|uniref:T9SS type A sorting domain-containing protein n=1 Tax=Pedobacter sp. UBA4863 TaxID=1947060 RepID=UPI0025EA2D9A|nr:T9SS type A sorting domain-containing protein [Pedobacter sp. UBA4863]